MSKAAARNEGKPERSGGAAAEQPFESTTWEWKRVKVRRPAGGHKDRAPKGRRWRRFSRREPSKWITVRLRFAGGPEAWVIVDGRGEVNPYPGYVALVDLVLDINQAR